MGRTTQRNWLLIITGVLTVSSALVLVFSIQEKFGFKTCAFDNRSYRSGDIIPGDSNGSNCYCSDDGEVVCEKEENTVSYKTFSSENLSFSYNYLNTLEKDEPSYANVKTTNISYKDNIITVNIEREVLCNSDLKPAVQVGFYDLTDKDLKLTIITNKDISQYTIPCMISDKFVISKVESINDGMKVLFQIDNGDIVDLMACTYENSLYGNGSVFQSLAKKICTCENGSVSCN